MHRVTIVAPRPTAEIGGAAGLSETVATIAETALDCRVRVMRMTIIAQTHEALLILFANTDADTKTVMQRLASALASAGEMRVRVVSAEAIPMEQMEI